MIDYELTLLVDVGHLKTIRVITGIGEKTTRHNADAMHDVVHSDPMKIF